MSWAADFMGQVQEAEKVSTDAGLQQEYERNQKRAQKDWEDARKGNEASQQRAATGVDYSRAYNDYNLSNQSRGENAGIGNYYKTLLGNDYDSAAQRQMLAGRDANIAQAMAMANSARGGMGAQAMQQRNALNAGQAATQQTVQQMGILRAQEDMQRKQLGLQAAGQYADMLRNQRALDLQQQGMSAQEAQYIADNEARQRAQNDAMSQAYMQQQQAAGGQQNNNWQAQAGQIRGQETASMQDDTNRRGQDRSFMGGMAAAAGSLGMGLIAL